MSHFVVIVVGENVQQALAPFQENNMGDCPAVYLTFCDTEDTYQAEYEAEGADRFFMDDGTSFWAHDQKAAQPYWRRLTGEEQALGEEAVHGRFRHRRSESFLRDGSLSHLLVLDPPGAVLRNAPFREVFPTFEEFMQEWAGHDKRDEKKGRYGYWRNQNAKWDWWSVGGRWTGYFLPKPGRGGEIGEPGVLTKPVAGRVDRIAKGDVDFEHMEAEATAQALADWDALTSIINPAEFDGFKDFSFFQTLNGADHGAAREAYWGQPAVKRFADLMSGGSEEAGKFRNMDPDYVARMLCNGRERHARLAALSAWVPFALLVDTEWHEKGAMGWLGTVSDETDDEKWRRFCRDTILALPDFAVLTAVDCHI